jgi:hypothetical protein
MVYKKKLKIFRNSGSYLFMLSTLYWRCWMLVNIMISAEFVSKFHQWFKEKYTMEHRLPNRQDHSNWVQPSKLSSCKLKINSTMKISLLSSVYEFSRFLANSLRILTSSIHKMGNLLLGINKVIIFKFKSLLCNSKIITG